MLSGFPSLSFCPIQLRWYFNVWGFCYFFLLKNLRGIIFGNSKFQFCGLHVWPFTITTISFWWPIVFPSLGVGYPFCQSFMLSNINFLILMHNCVKTFGSVSIYVFITNIELLIFSYYTTNCFRVYHNDFWCRWCEYL